MSIFAFFVLCIQACLIHSAYSACVGSLGYANGFNGLAAEYGAGWGGVGPCGLAGPYGGARYGGVGEGAIAAIGEMGVQGRTVVGGQVPAIGAVQFIGEVPAAGSVSIAGNCGCGCGAGAGYGFGNYY